ncbi:DUF262 domain-containing protein [Salinicoccus halitifaciens]|uniref:GmrSD restriction endonucleases N-terminal domain-containing protein n=1 Tax=Salinicoccus halitifaciens TaxID=1073415 RepID=A0ABV2E8P5_9STAP|nr:DUF262 domain-containing protein [Salinicoccus halitifaciens]MCD2137912.1 DUF262 domain-containing protein [Salinicoccus halitifaciens]
MKYRTDMVNFSELQEKATVNKFQRRLVWSEKEKIAFIETLKKGYPFGSILIYKYPNDNREEKFSIIDGLQRYTTMEDFNENPHKYIRDIDKFIDDINNRIVDDGISANTKNNYKKHISDAVNKLFEKYEVKERKYNTLYNILSNDSLIRENIVPYKEFIYEQQDKILNHVDEYLNVNDIKIPCIEFTGDETELANVFQNLNRGGKKLSKYQVFSAQWSNYTSQLSKDKYNNKILEIVINRYTELTENRNVDIHDFDESEMRTKREINLSEFCYALGILIIEKMNVFWSKNSSNLEDIANEIGYSSLGIILSVSNNKLHAIPSRRNFFSDPYKIEVLVSSALSIFENINNHFKKYLRVPGAAEKYEAKVASNFQVLSYFAALWVTKYNYDEESGIVTEKQGYKKKFDENLKNFLLYFIHDLVIYRWSGTGDKKLNDIYINNNERYLYPIELEDLEIEIMNWNEEQLNKSSIRHDNIAKTLYIIYLSFYINNHNENSYDYEHIFPKARFDKYYKDFRIPLGSLGNIMLLEKGINRSKKDNHILGNLVNISELKKDFIEIHEYPNTNVLSSLSDDLREKDLEKVKKEIENRSKKVITNLKENLSKSF